MEKNTIYKYDQLFPEWNETMEIGIEAIDREHRFFMDLIKEVYNEAAENPRSEFLQPHIDQIILYARFHFFSEEIFMRKIGFPGYDRHRQLHLQLIGKLSDQVTRFQMKETRTNEIIDFLLNWFKYHTLAEDVKIAEFLSP